MSENTKPDGGPAFPSRGGQMFYVDESARGMVQDAVKQLDQYHAGLTLRDFFAAKALSGLISESVPAGDYSTAAAMAADVGGRNSVAEIFACAAYQIADAMIAARGAA